MPRRGTLVGEAYVVMRADGSLMKRDMEDAASQAGEAGGDNFGSEFRKSWDAQIKKFENEQLPRFRDSITRMAADVDFQPFIRQFKSIDAARKSLDVSLNDYMREGLLSEEDKNLIVDRFEQSVVSIQKMEAETKKAAASAERAKHSFRNLMSQDEVNRAIKFGKQLAAAKIDKTFDNMAIKGESAAQAVERITADLKKYQRELSISNVEVHNFTRALEKWRRETDERHRIEIIDLEATRKATKAVEEVGTAFDRIVNDRRTAKTKEFFRLFADAHLTGDFKRLQLEGERFGQTADRLTRRLYLLNRQGAISDDLFRDMTVSVRRWRTEMELASRGRGLNVDEYERTGRTLRRVGIEIDRFGMISQRALGRGARNDFINIFGTIAGLPFRVIAGGFSIVSKSVGAVVEQMGKLKEAGVGASSGVGVMASMSRVLPAIVSALGGPTGVVAGIGALVAALAGIAYVVPAVVSAVSLLVGAITALAGGVVIGATAALLAFAPAAVAAVAGIGLFAKAVYDYSQSENGEKTFERLNKEIKKAAKEMIPAATRAIESLTSKVTSGIRTWVPSMNRVLDDFTRRMRDPENAEFFAAWRKSIGVMIENLGKGFNALGEGLMRFFVPILPYAEKLSKYIRDTFQSFSDWAGSDEGQEKIAGWMKRAWEIGKDLWGVLTKVATAVFKIFDIGAEGSGGGMLDSLNRKLQELNEWLDKPENRDKLNDWFADAGVIAGDLADIAGSVATIIGDLNSPEAREDAKSIFNALKNIASLAEGFNNVITSLRLVFGLMKAIALFGMGKPVEAIAAGTTAIAEYNAKMEAGKGDAERFAEAQAKVKRALEETAAATLAANQQGVSDWWNSDAAARVKVEVDDEQWQVLKQAVSNYVFDGKTIPIKGNKELWDQVKGTVAGYVFNTKDVKVKGDSSYWNNTKALVERYNFPSKKINVTAPSVSELAALRAYITRNLYVSIKARVSLPGVTGGSSTSGGITKDMSLTPDLGNPVGGGSIATQLPAGPSVMLAEGAVQINTRSTSPTVIQSYLASGLAEALERV